MRDIYDGASRAPADLISYLDVISRLDFVQDYKRHSHSLLQIAPGDRILDVGCGVGSDSLEIARLAGNEVGVVGVDKSANLILEARRRARATDNPPHYVVGDVCHLCFEEGTFAGCRADRVLHSLDQPRQALSEMIRVCRSGGLIIASEPDWGTLSIDAPNRSLTRKILNFLTDTVPSGWIGHQLPRIYKELNLNVIYATLIPGMLTDFNLANTLLHFDSAVDGAVQAGIIDWLEGFAWLDALKKASQEGVFFCGMTGIVICGQRS